MYSVAESDAPTPRAIIYDISTTETIIITENARTFSCSNESRSNVQAMTLDTRYPALL